VGASRYGSLEYGGDRGGGSELGGGRSGIAEGDEVGRKAEEVVARVDSADWARSA
jgi:hypothetical protein